VGGYCETLAEEWKVVQLPLCYSHDLSSLTPRKLTVRTLGGELAMNELWGDMTTDALLGGCFLGGGGGLGWGGFCMFVWGVVVVGGWWGGVGGVSFGFFWMVCVGRGVGSGTVAER